jgi:hypothetical protein
MNTGHIYTERIFGPDLFLHQARQTLREFINLTGLYTVLIYLKLLLTTLWTVLMILVLPLFESIIYSLFAQCR